MRVNILVGGPLNMIPLDIVKKRQNEKWIGVDRGAIRLLKWGIKPAIAIGDFDSITNTEMQTLKSSLQEIEVYPPEKDYTDTQLGVKYAIKGAQPDAIDIFGATGGRLDHLLANIFLPLQNEFKPYLTRIKIVDSQNVLTYYLPGSYAITHLVGKKYLCFVNLTPVTGLTLPDEKYPLSSWNSEIPVSWTSNEFTAPINHFSFKQGIVAVIQCNDPVKTTD